MTKLQLAKALTTVIGGILILASLFIGYTLIKDSIEDRASWIITTSFLAVGVGMLWAVARAPKE